MSTPEARALYAQAVQLYAFRSLALKEAEDAALRTWNPLRLHQATNRVLRAQHALRVAYGAVVDARRAL